MKKKRYTELFEIAPKEDGGGFTYCLNEDALEAGRIRMHSQETMDAKLFALFIALIIHSYLYQKPKTGEYPINQSRK